MEDVYLDREIKPTETRENLSALGVELVNDSFASKSQTKQRADFLQMTAWVMIKRRTRESSGSGKKRKREKKTLTRTASLDQ